MYNNIIPINVELLDSQIEIILKSLELYAFNLHNTWGVEIDSDLQERRNALIFHTYESLIAQKKDYRISYNLMKECRLLESRNKNKIYFNKKFA